MDGSHFDTLTRSFSTPAPRRGWLGVLTGLALVGFLSHDTAEAKRRKTKKRKKKKVTVCLNGQSTTVSKRTAFTLLALGAAYGPCPPPPPPQCPNPPCAIGQPCANRNECTTAFCNANTCQACSSGEQCDGDSDGPCFCGSGACVKQAGTSVNTCPDPACPAPMKCFEGGGSARCHALCGAV
jgi:hypothetical protein